MSARILNYFSRPRGPERSFLPAALEIVETPASPTLRITAALISALLVVAAIWSYIGQVDIVATASGKIIASSRTKVVQPYDAGVVRAIHVTDGQHVDRGEILLELDPTITTADIGRYSELLRQARLDEARLQSLLNPDRTDDLFAHVNSPASLVAAARARLEAEKGEQNAKLAKIDEDIAQKKAELGTIDATISKLDASVPLARERAQIRQQSMKSEFGSKLLYLEAEQQVVELEHERVVQQRKRPETEAAAAALVAQREQAESEFRRSVLGDLAKAEREISDATGELAKAEKRTELQTLRAPVAGVVQDLSIHTIGGVVAPGQQLLRIVPSDGRIEVEAVIANNDVGFVEVGQPVEIKIDTFPFTRYGLLHGRVREISHDSVESSQQDRRIEGSQSPSDQPSSVEHARQLVYTARISIEKDTLDIDGRPTDLVPGMSVVAEIKTGKRRVIDFLMSPFHRYTHDALRER